MPAPQHMRLIFSGIFGGLAAPQEDWQFSLAANPVAVADPNVDLLPYASVMKDFWLGIGGIMSQQVRLTNRRVAIIGADGKYTRLASGAYSMVDVPDDDQAAGGANLTYPHQVSLAVTLNTEAPGPTGRGRFYLPGPGGALDATGRYPVTTRDSYLTIIRDALRAADTSLRALAPPTQLVLASGGSATKGIAPALRDITTIGLGLRLDVQRRRAADLPEEPAVLPLLT